MTYLNVRVGVTMPAFNEGEGILSFIQDIYEVFRNNTKDVVFIISDDFSTDNTLLELKKGTELGIPIIILESQINTGSGPTTIRAWKESLKYNLDVLINTDGDGQYEPHALFEMVNKLVNRGLCVVEGRRINRNQNILRKVGSSSTRILVFLKTWKNPGDANCPTRAYNMSQFSSLLSKCPSDSITPNMRMAVAYRRLNLEYESIDLVFLPRRSKSNIGTHWAGEGRFSPSLKYIKFCFKALNNWFFH